MFLFIRLLDHVVHLARRDKNGVDSAKYLDRLKRSHTKLRAKKVSLFFEPECFESLGKENPDPVIPVAEIFVAPIEHGVIFLVGDAQWYIIPVSFVVYDPFSTCPAVGVTR